MLFTIYINSTLQNIWQHKKLCLQFYIYILLHPVYIKWKASLHTEKTKWGRIYFETIYTQKLLVNFPKDYKIMPSN